MKDADNANPKTQDALILVDSNDRPLGTMDKLSAHQQGLLHRAFSIFITRQRAGQTEVLMQQRHPDKYHCGGLWSNSCCSHPRPGETIVEAGQRRLQEELGFTVPLTHIGSFIYKAELDNNLIEHEFDHVLIGCYDGDITNFNIKEINQVQWLEIAKLKKMLAQQPEQFTPWLAKALQIADI